MTAGRIHTLDDLEAWDAPGTALAVLGHPIAHSLSPAMHHAALADLAREEPAFAGWRYHKFDIPPADLARALPLLHRRGFLGLNLTVPHKVMALDLVRRVDAEAAAAGAVNTLRRLEDGYEGFNTDGHGMSRAIRDELGLGLSGTAVILLGAGGAARAAALTCLREGCRELWIGNRTPAHLDTLLHLLAPHSRATGVPVRGFQPADPGRDLPADALLVNATSAGLKSGDAAPIDLTRLSGRPRVYDMIYNPPQTPLLRQAAALGLPAANGLSMLAHQGARALEIWTGRPVAAAVMLQACRDTLGRNGGSPRGARHGG